MRRFLPILCLALFAAQTNTPLEERLWRLRNLGKAFYENPTTQSQAVEEFRQALALAPNSARERLNYGLALLRAGKTDQGIAELIKVQKQDPSLPHTWFNLGVAYRKNGEFDKATSEFEKMTQLVPEEPVSHYNLGVLDKQAGKLDEARKQFEIARDLDPRLAAPHFQLYNLNRQAEKRDEAARELAEFQRIKKLQEGAVIPEDMEWCDYAEIYDPIDISGGRPPAEVPRAPLPAGADGQLLTDPTGLGKPEILSWNKDGIHLVHGAGLETLRGVISVAAGDFDNDGLADLCVLTESGPLLFHNAKGKFELVDAHLPARRFEKAVWIDYDHDYDLDLILLGDKPALLRNQGPAGFADHTVDFPFASGQPIDAVTYRHMADSKAFDLIVSYADRAGTLYADQLNGKYEAKELSELLAGARRLEARDVDHDGWLDIVSSAGTIVNTHGSFSAAAEPKSDGSVPWGAPARNSTWIQIVLAGVKNLKLGYDAEVEVKAGASYQKKIYRGVALLFDLGGRQIVDAIRITWPNGLIQNETKQLANRAYTYKEAQRMSGSCPMIWTWDGAGFRFITDVLGVAPLGATSGDGQYFPVDHQEYIQIPREALKEIDGEYEIRVTEELSEVSYLDQMQLFAVDHPANEDIFTSERWKGPPFPDFRLYGVPERVYPKSAHDGAGRDVLPRVLSRDRWYVDTFPHDLSGVAAPHTLDLDFGNASPRNRAVLVLNGWVDWADGSTFLSSAQEGKGGLIPPYLQVKDGNGEWKTVIDDMGMPDGKPKTIAVDLTGKFLTDSREVRIVTNLCVYWDEIFLGEDAGKPEVAMIPVPVRSADLHFRGFSQHYSDPSRNQPEEFIYAPSSFTSSWNPTPGLYTRYGDVKELLEAVDDRLVIMGSGDEIRLRFRADVLPPPKTEWKRDFIFKVDGWAKDRDANTAYSQSVEPLPFHAMSKYPYGANEHFPNDAAHEAYRKQYNTRPALHLIRPLGGAVPPDRAGRPRPASEVTKKVRAVGGGARLS